MNEPLQPKTLPYGARGIEAGDLVLEFRSDKVVFLMKCRNEHYTLHSGSNSGVLDLHRTWKDELGVERHETVFAIHRANIPTVLLEMSSGLGGFPRLIRRLRLGWLARHGIGVVRGLEFATYEDIAAATTKNRRKRLVVEEKKVRGSLHVPRYLDDVWDFPDGPFSLFQGNRRIGLAWKVTDKFGRPKLFWLKLRDLTRFSNQLGPQFIRVALRHAIPPEKYAEYGALGPRL